MKSVFSVFLLLVGLCVMVMPSHADIDVYEFSSEEKRQRYLALTRELRCPKCQNQDIADSNAPIAQDMRREVHRMVEEGKGSNDVVNFMVERFGDFVSYKPKLVPSTYILWFAPVILGLIGLIVVWFMASHKRKKSDAVADAKPLSQNEKAKIENLLARYDDGDEQRPEDKKE